MKTDRPLGLAGKFASVWIGSKLTPLVIAGSLLLGAFAVWKLPREEEPQIIVPMVDVFVADARRVGARSGRARHQTDGKTAVGDPRRGVHLLHFQPRHVHGDRALPGRAGRREEHRPAEPEAERESGPDPARRFASAGEAPLHRRRADPGADVLEQAVRRFRTAAHRGAGGRHDQTDAGRLGRRSDRRPAPRDSHYSGPVPPRRLQPFAACRWWERWAFPIAGCHRANSPAATRNIFSKPASSCAPPRMFATWSPASPTTSRSSCATSPK